MAPDFLIEVTTKDTFGPFTYASANNLRKDLVGGKLDMTEMEFEANAPMSIKIKELKAEK